MPRVRHVWTLDEKEAKLIVNAHAVGVGKKKVHGYAGSSQDRWRRSSQDIIGRWLSDATSMHRASADYLLAGDDDKQSLLRRLGLLSVVLQCGVRRDTEVSGNAFEDGNVTIGEEMDVIMLPAAAPDEDGISGVCADHVEQAAPDSERNADEPDTAPEEPADVASEGSIDFDEYMGPREEENAAGDTEGRGSFSFVQVLQDWAVRHKVKQAALTGLLTVLLLYKPTLDYALLPQTGRQLMKVSEQ